MKIAKRYLSKITGSILAVSLIVSICVTSGLLTTSAATLNVNDKVIDLASAKFDDSNSVKISGELSNGARASASSRFTAMSGIEVIGAQQTVAAGDNYLAASFIGSEFGELGSKMYDTATRKLVGDGFKVTAYIPSYSTADTFGMRLTLVNKEGKTEEYFCEKKLEKGRKHDVYFRYADFKRLATKDDYKQYNEFGTRLYPDPENFTAELPEYVGMGEYGFFGSYERRYELLKSGAYYVKSSTDAQANGIGAFCASDATIFEKTQDPKYFLKWSDGDIKMNGDHVFGAGDVPFERGTSDFFAPNGGIHLTGERYLHKDASYTNPVTGNVVENCDQNPKHLVLYSANYDKGLVDYNVNQDRLMFQVKQTPECNVAFYADSYTYGIGFLVKNPDNGEMKWYSFMKIFSKVDYISPDGKVVETMTIKAPLKSFSTEDVDQTKLTQADLKNITKMKIFASSEYYWDATINVDMQISDIYRYQGSNADIPVPQPEPPENVYNPEPDDSTTPPDGPNPSEPVTTESTTTGTTADPGPSGETSSTTTTTTTTTKPTTTTTTTTKPTTTTTTTTITAPTSTTTTSTSDDDGNKVLTSDALGFKIQASMADGSSFANGLTMEAFSAEKDYAELLKEYIASESDYYAMNELYGIKFLQNGIENTVEGPVKISVELSQEMLDMDAKLFIMGFYGNNETINLGGTIDGNMLTFETEILAAENTAYFALVSDASNSDVVPSEPVTDAPGADDPNPSTGSAAPIALAVLAGAAGMGIFFSKKRKK